MLRLAAILRLTLLLALAGIWSVFSPALAKEPASRNAIADVALSNLPVEARQTLNLIRQGGPFPYPHKDGSVFGNFERRLAPQSRGYYREFTVPTPGRQDRGPRRIVAGSGETGSVTASGEYYYTADHYRTFRRIREE